MFIQDVTGLDGGNSHKLKRSGKIKGSGKLEGTIKMTGYRTEIGFGHEPVS